MDMAVYTYSKHEYTRLPLERYERVLHGCADQENDGRKAEENCDSCRRAALVHTFRKQHGTRLSVCHADRVQGGKFPSPFHRGGESGIDDVPYAEQEQHRGETVADCLHGKHGLLHLCAAVHTPSDFRVKGQCFDAVNLRYNRHGGAR